MAMLVYHKEYSSLEMIRRGSSEMPKILHRYYCGIEKGSRKKLLPEVGRRWAWVGSMMPPVVFSSASATLQRTKSPVGFTCMGKLPSMSDNHAKSQICIEDKKKRKTSKAVHLSTGLSGCTFENRLGSSISVAMQSTFLKGLLL